MLPEKRPTAGTRPPRGEWLPSKRRLAYSRIRLRRPASRVRLDGMPISAICLPLRDACVGGASNAPYWSCVRFGRVPAFPDLPRPRFCAGGVPALAICSLQRAAYAVGCSLCSIMAPPWGVVSMHSIPRPPRFVKRAAPAKRKIQQGGRIGRSRQVFGQNRTARSRRPVAKSLRPQNACGRLGGTIRSPKRSPLAARFSRSSPFGGRSCRASSLPMPRTASAGHAQKTGRGFPAAFCRRQYASHTHSHHVAIASSAVLAGYCTGWAENAPPCAAAKSSSAFAAYPENAFPPRAV